MSGPGVVRGGNKKMVKQPNIGVYLEDYHPAVWKLFCDLDMKTSIIPRRGAGITFLLPDAKHTAAIQKAIESGSPEDATDMLSVLILRDKFESGQDFEKKKDDIPNMLGNTLVVEKTSKDSVEIAGEGGKATITYDDKFKPFERQGTAPRNNSAVWKLSGSVKLDTPRATFKYANKPGTGKPAPRPEADPEPTTGGDEVFEYARKIVIKQCDAFDAAAKSGDKVQCELSRAVACLLHDFEDKSDPAKVRASRIARGLITQNQYINFLLLFTAPTLFPPSLIMKCVDGLDEPDNLEEYIRDYTSSDMDGTGRVLSKSGIAELHEARDSIIDHIASSGYARAPEMIRKAYAELDQNKLGDITDVYPEELASIFAANAGYKQMLDEAYCWIFSKTEELNAALTGGDKEKCSKMFHDFIDSFATIYSSGLEPGSAPCKALECGTLDSASEAFTDKIKPFIEGFSLRIPTTAAQRSGAKYEIVGGDEDEDEAPPAAGPAPYDMASPYSGAYEPMNVGGGELKRKLRKLLKKKGADKALRKLLK